MGLVKEAKILCGKTCQANERAKVTLIWILPNGQLNGQKSASPNIRGNLKKDNAKSNFLNKI